MSAYRITKYNPMLRNGQGAYLADEWTSVSDIGKMFRAVQFNIQDYLATESRYVDSALYLWGLAQCPPLYVNSLETINYKTHLGNLPELCDVAHEFMPEKNQMLIDRVIIARVVRLILREFLWCKLEAKTGFYFHFGYDYYMYCGGVELSSENRDAVAEVGLFVEDFSSPYLE